MKKTWVALAVLMWGVMPGVLMAQGTNAVAAPGTNAVASPGTSAALVQQGASPASVLSAEMDKKLSSIIIPLVQWKDTSLTEAVAFLNDEAKKADPDKTGVEILLKTGEDRTMILTIRKPTLKVALLALCRYGKLTMSEEDGKIVLMSRGKQAAPGLPGTGKF